jgi:hypothetical protein
MQNAANRAPETAEATKKNLRERAVGELEKYGMITVYFWLLFALFSLHTRQLLQQHGMISVWEHGFALLNALVFGKIILIAQALEVGKSLERRALLWIVLGKSLIFAILLIAFHIVEGAIPRKQELPGPISPRRHKATPRRRRARSDACSRNTSTSRRRRSTTPPSSACITRSPKRRRRWRRAPSTTAAPSMAGRSSSAH